MTQWIAKLLAAIIGGVVIFWLTQGSPWLQKPKDPPKQKQKPYMGPLEGATNRNGGDLYDTGIQVNSAPKCSDMCEGDDNCKAMTFVKHPNANGGICWLKGSIPSPSPHDAMVSAVKIFP